MIAAACRLALGALGSAQRRLSIVIFHRVLDRPDPLMPDEPDIAAFERQLCWLQSVFEILPLREAAAALAAGRLPSRALAITFDDGYEDNLRNALPVLQRHGAPATFFINTAFTAGGLMWNDCVIEAVRSWPAGPLDLREFGLGVHAAELPRHELIGKLLGELKYRPYVERQELAGRLLATSSARSSRLMMDADQLRALHAAGMEIGGHTHTHPILARLSDEMAKEEIVGNKRLLEDIIGAPLATFAYPNGRPGRDYDARHVRMLAEAGYTVAVSTAPGTAHHAIDPLQLPRFTPWDRDESKYLLRMLRNYLRTPDSVPETGARA